VLIVSTNTAEGNSLFAFLEPVEVRCNYSSGLTEVCPLSGCRLRVGDQARPIL
jgi:hypothetical protein